MASCVIKRGPEDELGPLMNYAVSANWSKVLFGMLLLSEFCEEDELLGIRSTTFRGNETACRVCPDIFSSNLFNLLQHLRLLSS